MNKAKLEYIWIGGNNEIRTKTKIQSFDLDYDTFNIKSARNLPVWNYDGSSTNQASGEDSEVLLKPVKVYKNPFNKNNNIPSYLVLCETFMGNLDKPHPTNTRHEARNVFNKSNTDTYKPLFGIEREFFVYDNKPKPSVPLGWENGEPKPQGPYYCSVGAGKCYGKEFLEEALDLSLLAGLEITGSNIEVCPGQMEIQVCSEGLEAADSCIILSYILDRLGEEYNYSIDWRAKPIKGDWNGSGCHVNFSTVQMRTDPKKSLLTGNLGYSEIIKAIKRLETKHAEHIEVYGDDNNERLTGLHETSSMNKFSYGVANRGASIRIPRDTEANGYGYFEDRRPSSSVDLYLVTSKIFATSIGL
jgi:glutamine synthetase